MSHPPPDPAVLARAAHLKAAGSGWEVVAAQLDLPAGDLLTWPALFPAEWQAATRAAERQVLAEASAEAVLILRQLLRSKNEAVRRAAAGYLVGVGLEVAKRDRPADPPPPPPASDAARFVALLEGHTHEQLAELVAACRRSEVLGPRRALPPPGGGAD